MILLNPVGMCEEFALYHVSVKHVRVCWFVYLWRANGCKMCSCCVLS